MIKKNTKVVFEDNESSQTEEMVGGIPLSKGEIMHVHRNGETFDYEVTDKIIDCNLDGEDQIVDITYIVKKK
ncbi:MAG: hypothetical protein NTV48_02600 [Candidatus Vogelbacteria bacterium]|nr:hypothetical protein [Candidatus Vogelbacteria bacterium]